MHLKKVPLIPTFSYRTVGRRELKGGSGSLSSLPGSGHYKYYILSDYDKKYLLLSVMKDADILCRNNHLRMNTKIKKTVN